MLTEVNTKLYQNNQEIGVFPEQNTYINTEVNTYQNKQPISSMMQRSLSD